MKSIGKKKYSGQGKLVVSNGWGGRRPGAGAKPKGDKPQVPHARRQTFRGPKPVHITILLALELGEFKRKQLHQIVRRALLGQSQFANVRARTPCRDGEALVQEFTVTDDEVHILVDADDADAVSRAVKSWGGRIAWEIRALRAERESAKPAPSPQEGPRKIFRHRYDAKVLNTPSEVRLARDSIRANSLGYMTKAAVRASKR